MGFSRQEYWSGVPLPSLPLGLNTFYILPGPPMRGQYTTSWGEGGEGWAAVDPASVLTQFCSGRSEVQVQWCRFRTQTFDTEDLNISVSRQLMPLP